MFVICGSKEVKKKKTKRVVCSGWFIRITELLIVLLGYPNVTANRGVHSNGYGELDSLG